MPPTPACALCQSPAPLVARPLVPPGFREEGIFDIDPLGTGGATLPLCAGCRRMLDEPMLLAEDAATFARALCLHAESHPAPTANEALAARIRLWHRALHLGLQALVAELVAPPVVAPARAEPDQLGLFSSRTARLARLGPLLEAADWSGAAAVARELDARFGLPEAHHLARTLPLLEERARALATEPDLFAAAVDELAAPGPLGPELATPLRRGLHRAVAQAADGLGRPQVRARLTGWYWMQAGDRERARRALQAVVDQGVLHGEALVQLGNLAFEEENLQAAREAYRRAFCEEPGSVEVGAVADPAVGALVEEARALELEPAAAWVPLVGWASGLFWLPPEPQGQEPCRSFHQALLASRKGADVAARRRMKELAPLLFEQLRDDKKLG